MKPNTTPKTQATTALIAGFAVLAAIVGAALLHAPATVARTNGVLATESIWGPPKQFCQANEVLPRGVAAVRVFAQALVGPRVTLTAVSHGRVVAAGEQESGWSGENVTVPLQHAPSAASRASICVKFGAADEARIVYGEQAHGSVATRSGEALPQGFRVKIEYLEPGHRSWLSLATVVARHMGLGHAWKGSWIVLPLAALMAAAAALGSWLVVRDLR